MSLQGRMPRWLLYLMIGAVALFWVSAFFVLGEAGATVPRPFVDATGLASCPRAAGDEAPDRYAGNVGVNLGEAELTEPALSRSLDLLQENGVRWIRFTVPWDRIEPDRGRFDWTWTDAIFSALAEHREIQPLVVLDHSPAWARAAADSENVSAPPHERADFGSFAAAIAKRYGSQVRYYQVWNEPNIAPHWGARPVAPADYLGLLREAAVQIRAADPDAQIVLAGLAPTLEQGGANLSDLVYLDALYRLNARPWFDLVAAQPFGFSQAASTAPSAASLNFGRASLLRQVMDRHGDLCTPLWSTAFGWSSPPGDKSQGSSPWGRVTETEQANYLRDATTVVSGSGTRFGPLFWAAFCPSGAGDSARTGFALCAPGSDLASGVFLPRPSWTALQEAEKPPAVLRVGDYPTNHPALHYEGDWRVMPSAADPGKAGGSLSFDFNGADLALRVQGGPYWALYRVWVDGAPANALPRDEAGVSYLVLYDPLSELRSIPVATGLQQGTHHVRLEAVGGWGQWALQGISIRTLPPARRWLGWLLLALAVVGTLLLGAVVWRTRTAREGVIATTGKRSAQAASPRATWLDRAALRGNSWLWLPAIGLLILLVLSRWFILDLVAIAGLGLLFLIRPDLSLPLIAASIPFWPRPEHLLRWEFSLFEILVWLAAASLALRWVVVHLWDTVRISGSRIPRASDPQTGQEAGRGTGPNGPATFAEGRLKPHLRGLDWPVLALLSLGLISALFAQRGDVALREYRTVFLGAVFFYWLITRVPGPVQGGKGVFSPWPLLNGLLVGAVVVSLVAIWQLLTGQGRVDVEGVWRVRAFYGSPNNLALVLDRIIPLALAVAAFGSGLEGAGASRTVGLRTLRAIYGLAAAVMVVACMATFSKGALLLGLPVGMGLVLILGAWRAQRRWPLALFAGLVGLGVAALALLATTTRFADLLNFRAGTSFFRLKLWQGAWHMALDHPWLGVGPDNFLYAYRTRYVLPSAWQELNLSHPHNIVLDLWTRLGIPGLAVGIWAIWAAVRRAWSLLRGPDAALWPIALGLLGGLAVTVTHGMIDNSLFLVDLMALFMLTLGLLQRLSERN